MTEPKFIKDGSSSLYFLQPASGGNVKKSVAYRPWSGMPSSPLNFSDSWGYDGWFIFTDEDITDTAAFDAYLEDYHSKNSRSNIRFIWIKNAKDYDDWKVQIVYASIAESETVRNSIIKIGSYALHIGVGCPITVKSIAATDDYGFAFSKNAAIPRSFLYSANNGADLYDVQDATTIRISFEDGIEGAVKFHMLLRSSNPDQWVYPNIQTLDIGCRYYFDNFEYYEYGYMDSLYYPVVDVTAGNDIEITAQVHPLYPLNVEISHWSIEVGNTFDTYYTTNYGENITAVSTDSSKFVYSEKPLIQGNSAANPFTMTLQGEFKLSVTKEPGYTPPTTGIKDRFMPGTAGIEYFGFTTSDYTITFIPEQPAYSPVFVPPGYEIEEIREVKDEIHTGHPLTDFATTAYAYLNQQGSSNMVYYAQPDESALYGVNPNNVNDQDLIFLELPAGQTPYNEIPTVIVETGENAKGYPTVPYTGVDHTKLETFQSFEQQVLSPVRRQVIYRLSPTHSISVQNPPSNSQGSVFGSNPQGLLVGLDDDKEEWKTVTIAHLAEVRNPVTNSVVQPEQQLQFSDVVGPFQSTLQSNQMFMVVSNPDTFLEDSSTNFLITEDGLDQMLVNAPSGSTDLEAAVQSITSAQGTSRNIMDELFVDQNYFEYKLLTIVSQTVYDEYKTLWLSYCSYCRIILSGWEFHLNPYFWEQKQTVMIFKFGGKSVRELIEDPSTWNWQEAAWDENGSVLPTQQEVQGIIDAAIAPDASEDYEHFAHIVTDPNWNGVLFLKCFVPPTSFPPALAGLAGGIKDELFSAHHLGFNITPVHNNAGTLELQNSSIFGLIDYEDPQNLFYEDRPYGFKVQQLKVAFSNSVLESFSSKIELNINSLFGENATLENSLVGNNLIIDGVYQKHDGEDSYIFVMKGDNHFVMDSQVLDEIEILKVQFLTINPSTVSTSDDTVYTVFKLWGYMKFKALEYFDAFSFGNKGDDGDDGERMGLSFSNLYIYMHFPEADNENKSFLFDASAMSFDISQSVARPTSLYEHFPLTFLGLVQDTGQGSPGDLGYIKTSTPLRQGHPTAPWYGLNFKLELGTLGDLASNVGLEVDIIAAWSPSENDYDVFIGTKLPGAKSEKAEIPLEGVLKLKFKSIDFTTSEEEQVGGESNTTYVLRLRRIALSLLSLSFPPGQTDIYIFGNPGESGRTKLGWYAAYAKDE